MHYYSTNNPQHRVSLREAVLKGLAPDNGLYMPDKIPALSQRVVDALPDLSFQEIAFEVAYMLLSDDLSKKKIQDFVEHTIAFDAPLVEIEAGVFTLELFHGPTLAFKDFGARFMSQALSYFAEQQQQEVTVLVATSGDTGSAVANGFLGVPGTRLVVLYPSGKVSDIQEKQFTTLGKNITAIEVAGTFDDCQRLVKQAFLDNDLTQKYFLTSANSINISRLIPQSFYYFYAWSRLSHRENVVFSVPSGNFGNLTAGLIAKKMGLPIRHFVASTNTNDVVPHYLATKIFSPRASLSTISNAMDVGNPSNFARMLDLYANDFDALSRDVTGYSFTDDETRTVMKNVFTASNYVLDPHGAVGYAGLKRYLQRYPAGVGVFLETAHPAKFNDVVEKTLHRTIDLPEKLHSFMNNKKVTIKSSADYETIKEILMAVCQ
jgi:threonine synthase